MRWTITASTNLLVKKLKAFIGDITVELMAKNYHFRSDLTASINDETKNLQGEFSTDINLRRDMDTKMDDLQA